MTPERSFKRLVRNARRAGELYAELAACPLSRGKGPVSVLVPGKLYDEVLAMLATLSEVGVPSRSDAQGEKR